MSELEVLTERELLDKVALGDEHAFSVLFRNYSQQLGTHIYRITESMELAEEVVSDVFMKIWLNRETLDTVLSFKAFLYVSSKNHALNCLRKVAKERALQVSIDENSMVFDMADNNEPNNYYALIDQAINHLPPQQQKVYLLSRHDRLKYDEIACKMGLSRETVKKYIQASTLSITNFIQANIDVTMMVLLAVLFF